MRLLTGSAFVSSLGVGAFATMSVVFFVRSVGLGPRSVAIGLAASGLVGLATVVFIGRLADRRGPREVAVGMSVVHAGLIASYVLVNSFATFFLLSCLFAVSEAGGAAARSALIAGVLGREERVAVKAYQRSTFNLGFSLGSAAAAIPLAVDTRSCYLIFILGNAATALLTVVFTGRLPHVPPTAARGRSWTALRDGRYLATSVVVGLLMVHQSLLVVGLPVWVSRHSHLPMPVLSALFVLNNVLVVLMQVSLSRGSGQAAGASKAARRGAFYLAGACMAIASTSATGSPTVGITFLVLGVVVLTLGEMLTAAAAWGLAFDLAPAEAQGEYQSVFAIGVGLERVVGPILATSVAVAYDGAGWLIFALYFIALAVVVRPAVSAAASSRSLEVPASAGISGQ
jgi:MFS family permease